MPVKIDTSLYCSFFLFDSRNLTFDYVSLITYLCLMIEFMLLNITAYEVIVMIMSNLLIDLC